MFRHYSRDHDVQKRAPRGEIPRTIIHPSIYNSHMRARTTRRLPWMPVLLCAAVLAQPKSGEWRSMFDGKTLQGWRETAFTQHGKARVQDGKIVLAPGAPMTGVTWSGDFPKSDYEVRFEAARIDGNDFFASLTFQIGRASCRERV